MKSVIVFGKTYEADFLAAWIKYLRITKGYSQEYLSKGICSKSHLSYFENCKKSLRAEVIELLIKKLDIKPHELTLSMGKIRQLFVELLFAIENSNEEKAHVIYKELVTINEAMAYSPYLVEYRIYLMYYKLFIKKKTFSEFEKEFNAIDNIYDTLTDELKRHYMLLSGKAYYKYVDHKEGIRRLKISMDFKETPYINYLLGFSYSFDDQPVKGIYYLEKALESYTNSGHYINALWCHNNLGICYVNLKLYDDAEKSYFAALNGAEYFDDHKILDHLYINIADLYLKKEDFKESLIWSKRALPSCYDKVLMAINFVEAYIGLNDPSKLESIFDKYLTEDNSSSKYYLFLKYYRMISHDSYPTDFETVVADEILGFYKSINYITICDEIRHGLIQFYESNRRYKDANKLYKELLR